MDPALELAEPLDDLDTRLEAWEAELEDSDEDHGAS